MEIYRTDGGGRLENPPRLIAVIGMVMQRIPDTEYIWNNIDSIEDHKGFLTVTLAVDFLDINAKRKFKMELTRAWVFFGESEYEVSLLKESGGL
jgi:hypothetical protein